MTDDTTQPQSQQEDAAPYSPPTVEVISLDCEISAYAPDDQGETPLF